MQVHAILADLVVTVHLCYLFFAVGGQVFTLAGALFGWGLARNLPFRAIHLMAVIAVGWEAAAGWACPLTTWEYRMRLLAGQNVDSDISFVGRIARSILFYDLPATFFTILHLLFAAMVVATFIVVPPRSIRRKAVSEQ